MDKKKDVAKELASLERHGDALIRRAERMRAKEKSLASTAKPPPLTDGYRDNFYTLERASGSGDLALVSAIRKSDKKAVALVCAMQKNSDGTITPMPLAVMCEGNPFEDFEDPTV